MRKFLRFIIKSCIWFFILSVLWVVVYRYVDIPATPLMAIRYVQQDKPVEIKHNWVALEAISEHLQKAVICSEDQLFLSHNGFDVEAIKKAAQNNKEGKSVRGGSTISQQTAKNVFLWPQRSWLRKGMETYFTFLIETFWPKERILEVYLNSIEFGEGVYGAAAAAEYWFNVSSGALTKDQSAALAAILPNPRSYKANPPSAYISARKRWIKQQMNNFGPLQLEQTAQNQKDAN